jgi:hypothetical protein
MRTQVHDLGPQIGFGMLADMCPPAGSQQLENDGIIQQKGFIVKQLVGCPETGYAQGGGAGSIFFHGEGLMQCKIF